MSFVFRLVSLFFLTFFYVAVKASAGHEEEVLTGSVTIVSGDSPNMVTVDVEIDDEEDMVTITMAGPDGLWYGVGFGGSEMANTYAIVSNANGSEVGEYILATSAYGTALSSEITVTSNGVSSSMMRTIILTRSLNVGNGGYNFSDEEGSIPVIGAYGLSGESFMGATGMGSSGDSATLEVEVASAMKYQFIFNVCLTSVILMYAVGWSF